MKTKLQIILGTLTHQELAQNPKISEAEADEIFGILDERKQRILKYRFIDGDHTLQETGEKLGGNRKRIHQLQNIALARLRVKLKMLIDRKETIHVNNQLVISLDIPIRVQNALTNANIVVIGQLRQRTKMEMLQLRNFGEKTLRVVHEALMREYQIDAGWYNS